MLSIDLKGKNALVCGSTQGIGYSIAEVFARAGAHVTLLARNKDQLKLAIPGLEGAGHNYMVADFSHIDSIVALEAQIRSGGYHILVNNAGGPPPGAIQDATWVDFQKALDMHLKISHQLTQYVLEAMKSAGYGRIINIISTSVKIPLDGLGVSNTVRGAMASWAKTMANELGPYGITVNNLLPGFMKTGRLDQIIQNKAEKTGKTVEELIKIMESGVPGKRFGEPIEMGYLAAFLASPMAGYVNGTSIPVDGGRTGSI